MNAVPPSSQNNAEFTTFLPLSQHSLTLGQSQHFCSLVVSRFMVTVSRCTKSYKHLVIVTNIWQKLSSVEHKQMLIVKNNWQLFSQIIGETLLIVRNIWRNHTSLREQVNS